MGADTLVIKKKHERNPMTQEQKGRPENAKTLRRGEGRIGPSGLCAQGLQIEDRLLQLEEVCCGSY